MLTLCAGQASAAGVAWQPDWSYAVAQSQRSNHWILVDFYTDWCGWCKKMDRDVYPNPAVAQVMAQYVPVRLNAEKAGKDLANRYQITGYPTILIVDTSGKVIDRSSGYMKPADFAAWLQEVLQDGGGELSAPPPTEEIPGNSGPGIAASNGVIRSEAPSRSSGIIHMSRIHETTKFIPSQQGDPIEPTPTLALAQKYLDRGDVVGAGRIAVKFSHSGGAIPAAFYSKLGDAALQDKKADAAWGWYQMERKVAKTPDEKANAALQSARAELTLGSIKQATSELQDLTTNDTVSGSIQSQAQALLDEIDTPDAPKKR